MAYTQCKWPSLSSYRNLAGKTRTRCCCCNCQSGTRLHTSVGCIEMATSMKCCKQCTYLCHFQSTDRNWGHSCYMPLRCSTLRRMGNCYPDKRHQQKTLIQDTDSSTVSKLDQSMFYKSDHMESKRYHLMWHLRTYRRGTLQCKFHCVN